MTVPCLNVNTELLVLCGQMNGLVMMDGGLSMTICDPVNDVTVLRYF